MSSDCLSFSKEELDFIRRAGYTAFNPRHPEADAVYPDLSCPNAKKIFSEGFELTKADYLKLKRNECEEV